jgi:CRISPR type I-E-associated protein CasB/Cse2
MNEDTHRAHIMLWRTLTGGGDRSGANRADRAALRKLGCTQTPAGEQIDLLTALAIPSFQTYRKSLGIGLKDQQSVQMWERLAYAAVAASAIAWIDANSNARSVATLLGGAGRDVLYSEVRFKRLLRCDSPERLLPEAQRMARILGRAAPVGDLGDVLANWGHETWGPRKRRNWAFDYWKQTDAEADTSQFTDPSSDSETETTA